MTVNHAPLNRPVDLDQLRPAWSYTRTETGFRVTDPDGSPVAYAVGEKAAAIIAEGMTVYAQLDDDQIASEAEVRADRDVLAAENGSLREERDQLRQDLADTAVPSGERLARQSATIRDLLTQNVRQEQALQETRAERDEARELASRYGRDRDDLRNQVISVHDELGATGRRLAAVQDDAELAGRSANRYRDERDRVRTELATCRRTAGEFRRDVASALDLPTDTVPVAIVDRARLLAERYREHLRGIARAMNAEAEAGGSPRLSDWLGR